MKFLSDSISFVPKKFWFTLHECCELKGLCYKTACNQVWLQPNAGKAEGKIGGRKMWSYETVVDWVQKTDSDFING